MGVEVQNMLAVVALAGLDELQIVLLELPDLDDMILGFLELYGVSSIAWPLRDLSAPSYASA